MRADMNEQVATELKRFAADLKLTDEQRAQLKPALEDAHKRIEVIREQNPNASKEDKANQLKAVRGSSRERVTKILTPEQLTKWDTEVTKAREFLGERID